MGVIKMKLRSIISISLIVVFVMSLVVTPAFALRMHRPENIKRQAEIDKYGPCENKPNLVTGAFEAADWLIKGTFDMVGSVFDGSEKAAKNVMSTSSSTVNSAIDTSGAAIDGTLKKSGEVVDDTLEFTDDAVKGTTGIIINSDTK